MGADGSVHSRRRVNTAVFVKKDREGMMQTAFVCVFSVGGGIKAWQRGLATEGGQRGAHAAIAAVYRLDALVQAIYCLQKCSSHRMFVVAFRHIGLTQSTLRAKNVPNCTVEEPYM